MESPVSGALDRLRRAPARPVPLGSPDPAVPVGSPDPAAPDPGPLAGAAAPGRRRWLLPAAAVALTAVLASLVLVTLRLRLDVARADRQDRYVAQVAAAARQQAVNFVSFDYRDLAAFERRLEQNSVGQFRAELPILFADIRLKAAPLKAVSTANVVDVAVINASATQGSALVAVDQIVRNTKNASVPAGQVPPNRERLRIDLVRVGQRWLTSGLTPIA